MHQLVLNFLQWFFLQVCIVPHSMCYQVDMHAYLVIVMDTQFYNGKHHVYEDCPISDILHMVGMAGRAEQDEDGEIDA
jgi:pre-mRNA-splicing helicase BRR2